MGVISKQNLKKKKFESYAMQLFIQEFMQFFLKYLKSK